MPSISTRYVPAGVSVATVIVSFAACEGVIVDKLNDAVSPKGVNAVRLTFPEKTFETVKVIVELAFDPAGIVRMAGVEFMEKSGPVTVTETKA